MEIQRMYKIILEAYRPPNPLNICTIYLALKTKEKPAFKTKPPTGAAGTFALTK
jgi:hypothetical protein